MEPELLLLHGDIHTMDPLLPRARAIALRAGRVVAVGSEEQAIAALGARPRRIDLGGRCVIPGLTDSHLHFRWYAESLRAVDVEAPTLAEAMSRIKARAEVTPPGAWITGSGWNHNVWGSGALPTLAPLDAVAPRNPVALKAKSGHALWANSVALRLAGIRLDTADPEGGKIAHGTDGTPSGILLENAMDLVQSIIPVPSAAECADMMVAAQAAAHRVGLTGIHDFDGTLAFHAFQILEARGELTLRVVKGIPHEKLDAAIAWGVRTGFGSERIVTGAVKMFADGALGPMTAAMIAPYENTWATGISTLTEEQARADVARANRAGIACAIHAIGDAACHMVLNAFQAAAGTAAPGALPIRNRIEHAQLLHPDDLPRLARLGVIASMQPLHATSDMLIAERHWGSRCAGAYAWKSLLDSGADLCFGSDCPVESPNPLAGIHAAVTRRRDDGSPGPEGWRPEQRLSVEQAVRAYTTGAAHAGGRDQDAGCLSPGRYADLVVLDRDIFRVDPHELRDAAVAMTIAGGVVVYGSP